MLIEWSAPAYDDLNDILSYFEQMGRAELGQDIVADIVSLADVLARFPMSGREGRVSGTRELINHSFPYILVYSLGADVVRIVRVMHMSREFRI